MHQMEVEYLGGLRTKAIHLDSKNEITNDAPKDNQGKGEAFSPTDMLCTSLATCMLTTAAIRVKYPGVDLSGVKIQVEKKMQASPRKVAEIVLRFDWQGLDRRIPPEHLEEVKEACRTCPVALSLDPQVVKTLIW